MIRSGRKKKKTFWMHGKVRIKGMEKLIQAGRRMGKSTFSIFVLAKTILPPKEYKKFCEMYQITLDEMEEEKKLLDAGEVRTKESLD